MQGLTYLMELRPVPETKNVVKGIMSMPIILLISAPCCLILLSPPALYILPPGLA